MSRCIDANDLVREMTLKANRTMFGEVAPPQLSYNEMLELIADAPTVDVVPKSDVDLCKKQVDELEDELASTYDKLENANAEVEKLSEINGLLTEAGQEWQRRYNNAKAEAVKEVFEEIEKYLLINARDIALISHKTLDAIKEKHLNGAS